MDIIVNFHELLKDFVGCNRNIIHTKVTKLTTPGENYMSDIFKINLKLKNNNDDDVIEDVHLVAKLVVTNDFTGPTANLTKNEILFYEKIVPALESFQERYGVEFPRFFPKYVAGRINLNGSDVPDKDAVVVLEDLSEKGYENIDRHIGFDLQEAKLILKDLAIFHSVPLAMRLLEPETYKSEILSNCHGFIPEFPKKDEKPDENRIDILTFLLKLFKSDEKYTHIIPIVTNFFKNLRNQIENNTRKFFTYKPDTQFETMTHEDMWSNNTMQIRRNGKLIHNMFIDFQMVRSNTLFNDLIFFIVSSVQLKYLQENFDELIQFYYENFSETLKRFGCFTSEYTYEKFMEALPKECQKGILQCTFMMVSVIFQEKGIKSDIKSPVRFENVPLIAKEKVGFLFLEAVKRGWLA
ncbi:uncharacterized protein LOC130447054 [Diorhabda sublineata]|uniref:uncharacterized protein LOC130447054 n=1 Tax=Diorhabda sublineata TaxID=1163346 RepID=UPI0024E0EE5D|nr:uncharacterized protein LOC130447054 [Diorhabda sublineata]